MLNRLRNAPDFRLPPVDRRLVLAGYALLALLLPALQSWLVEFLKESLKFDSKQLPLITGLFLVSFFTGLLFLLNWDSPTAPLMLSRAEKHPEDPFLLSIFISFAFVMKIALAISDPGPGFFLGQIPPGSLSAIILALLLGGFASGALNESRRRLKDRRRKEAYRSRRAEDAIRTDILETIDDLVTVSGWVTEKALVERCARHRDILRGFDPSSFDEDWFEILQGDGTRPFRRADSLTEEQARYLQNELRPYVRKLMFEYVSQHQKDVEAPDFCTLQTGDPRNWQVHRPHSRS